VRIVFTSHGWEDYASWTGDRKMLARINRLITEAARDPATGTGKPERLRGDLSGCWSRRIDHEHRLVYTVIGDDLVVLQVRYHY
jgi:toxin YoeB